MEDKTTQPETKAFDSTINVGRMMDSMMLGFGQSLGSVAFINELKEQDLKVSLIRQIRKYLDEYNQKLTDRKDANLAAHHFVEQLENCLNSNKYLKLVKHLNKRKPIRKHKI